MKENVATGPSSEPPSVPQTPGATNGRNGNGGVSESDSAFVLGGDSDSEDDSSAGPPQTGQPQEQEIYFQRVNVTGEGSAGVSSKKLIHSFRSF